MLSSQSLKSCSQKFSHVGVAFLEEKFTGEDDLSHHVQADERQTGNSSK